jgi:hypothetical protein
MRDLRSRLGIAVVIGMALGVTTVPAATAQEEAAASLCAVLEPAEVRDEMGVKMAARQDVTYCQWGSTEFGDPETSLSLHWSELDLAETRALVDDGTVSDTLTELTVGGRPALLRTSGLGDVSLLIELDQGIVQMTAHDTQGNDFTEAIESLGGIVAGRGDTLVPLPVIDTSGLALPPTLRDQPIAWGTTFVDEVFPQGEERRKELRKAVEDQGASLSDVTIASGIVYFDDDSVILNAFQVPGADITELVDFAINAAGLYGGYTIPDEIADGSVVSVETPSGYQMLLYPNGDTAWSILAEGVLADEALATLPGAPTRETIAQPPVGEPVAEVPAGGPTAVEMIGDSVAGRPVAVVSDQLGSGFMDPKSRSYKSLTKALAANDMESGDVTFTLASASDQSFGVTALEVGSADASEFVDFTVLSVIEGAGQNPRKVKPKAAEVAGKAVSVITLKAGGEIATAYVYPQGGVVWTVITQDDAALAEEILATLP